MVFVRASQVLMLIAALLVSPAFASRVRRAAATNHRHHAPTTVRRQRTYVRHYRNERHHRYYRRARAKKSYGQHSIGSARATQIQDALIKAKYLTGPASGTWDAETIAAMKKYQADHGWQTRLMPDSRALIALGLGPSQDHIPQSASAVDAAQVIDPQPNTLASVHTISQ